MGSSPIWGDREQSGAAEACWAHNPEVDRSKLSSAICVLPGGFAPLWVSPLQLIPDTSSQTPQYPTVTLMTHIIAGCNYDLNLTIAIHTLTQGTNIHQRAIGGFNDVPVDPNDSQHKDPQMLNTWNHQVRTDKAFWMRGQTSSINIKQITLLMLIHSAAFSTENVWKKTSEMCPSGLMDKALAF